MAKKISELTELTTSNDIHGTDELIINDVSDTTQSDDGSTKRLLVSTLSGAIGGTGGGGGGSSDSIASSTQNTMVSAYEPTGDSAIRFVVDGSRKLDVDSTGNVVPLSGGFGTLDHPVGTSIIGGRSLWIGDWGKLIENSNRGMSIAIRGTDYYGKPAVVKAVETANSGASDNSDSIEMWYMDQMGLNTALLYDSIPLKWVVEYVRQAGGTDYANATVDDVIPSPGMAGYEANDWLTIQPIVHTSPKEYTNLTLTEKNNESYSYQQIDMELVGGADNFRVDWSDVSSTANRLEFKFSKFPPTSPTYAKILADNMSSDFAGVRYADASTNNIISGEVKQGTVGSFSGSADYNSCEFHIRTSGSDGNTYYMQIDSNELTGGETAAYSLNGDKFYGGTTSYMLYQILDGDGGDPVSGIYVYMYSSGGALTGGETIDAGSGTSFGGLEWGNKAVATTTNSDGFATHFYVVQQNLDLLITKTYHNYSDYTSQQPWSS